MTRKECQAMGGIATGSLGRLPERLRQAVIMGHAPVRILRHIADGQDGRGPRSTRPKVDVREFVRSLG